jgi:hypothetical protein
VQGLCQLGGVVDVRCRIVQWWRDGNEEGDRFDLMRLNDMLDGISSPAEVLRSD